MKQPLISVVIPVYNVEKYLPRCIESVVAQTYKNLEIIVVDDGSKKVCADLCDTYADADSRISVFHKENGGLSDARNYGIERAKGEYITFIDSDDYVDNDYVEYLYAVLKKYRCKLSVCQHRMKYGNGSTKDYGDKGDEALNAKQCIERMLYDNGVGIYAWAKLYHCSLFKRIKFPKGKLFEDNGTTYALMMLSERIALGNGSKYSYVLRSNSITQCDFSPAKFDLLEMTDKMATDVLCQYPGLKSAVCRRQVYARFSTLNQMLKVSGYEGERQALIDYIKRYRKEVFFDPKTPRRDRAAILLLSISYRLYRACWLGYLKHRNGSGNQS